LVGDLGGFISFDPLIFFRFLLLKLEWRCLPRFFPFFSYKKSVTSILISPSPDPSVVISTPPFGTSGRKYSSSPADLKFFLEALFAQSTCLFPPADPVPEDCSCTCLFFFCSKGFRFPARLGETPFPPASTKALPFSGGYLSRVTDFPPGCPDFFFEEPWPFLFIPRPFRETRCDAPRGPFFRNRPSALRVPLLPRRSLFVGNFFTNSCRLFRDFPCHSPALFGLQPPPPFLTPPP